MIRKGCPLVALLAFMIGMPSSSEAAPSASSPLVYAVENSGANFPAPPLPARADLPTIEPLTDPFEWSDGSARSTNFADWSRRRAQIKAELEHYEIGRKPDRPEKITASYTNRTLTVKVTVGTNTLTLTSQVTVPEGTGPFPAVIGMGGGTGSLPADIFRSRNIAQISFNFGQVMAHTQNRGREPINKLYPELTSMGAYSAWPWGVSRLIDGLELVQDVLPIDLKHLAVTGCSFAGKMALFCGAFDERIALTIAQEPGGGGAAAWRVSQTLGRVETLGATSHAWFMESMFQFSGVNVSKLPMDHHELCAMVAPRALLVLGNPDYAWLADESGYVSSRAAHEVWKTFGIGNRMGFSFVAGHGHCQLPNNQRPEVEAFVEKFLLGNTNANTDVTIAPKFTGVDYARWFQWWGTGKPVLPASTNVVTAPTNAITVTLEAECGSVGSAWEVVADTQASNGKYVTAKAGMQSPSAAPAGSTNFVTIPFSVPTNGTYVVFARVDCPSPNDDSFWVKMDEAAFAMNNDLGTSGWEWRELGNFTLTAGAHVLTIAPREDGAKLDKVSISDFAAAPDGLGKPAGNSCP